MTMKRDEAATSRVYELKSALDAVGRPIFTNDMWYFRPLDEEVAAQELLEAHHRNGVDRADAGKPHRRLTLKRVKSHIDNEHGVEWLPLKTFGFPKRLIVLRGDAANMSPERAHELFQTKNFPDEYRGAPVFCLPVGGDLELYEIEE
jgi:hypothetical protein